MIKVGLKIIIKLSYLFKIFILIISKTYLRKVTFKVYLKFFVFSFSNFDDRKRVLVSTRNALDLSKEMGEVPWDTKEMFCDNLRLFGYTLVELVKLTVYVETNSVFDVFWRPISISIRCTLFIIGITTQGAIIVTLSIICFIGTRGAQNRRSTTIHIFGMSIKWF